MSASYLERANQVGALENVGQFLAKYAEVNRVLRFLDGSTAQAAQRVFDLYKRHAGEVNAAIDEMVRLREGGFPDEQAAGNPHQCWVRCEVLLRRNREWAASENGKRPDTKVSGAAASFAARPEPAPVLAFQGKKKGGQSKSVPVFGGGIRNRIRDRFLRQMVTPWP
ncbi:MAG: hypothetical protein Q4A98_03295 [Comamonadaceae bacterium]|nr:hypothetical protein [Comamonadaceae bacterium]